MAPETKIEAAALVLGLSVEAVTRAVELLGDEAYRFMLSAGRTVAEARARGDKLSWLDEWNEGAHRHRMATCHELLERPKIMTLRDIDHAAPAGYATDFSPRGEVSA